MNAMLTVLVFDSGLGGLSVHAELAKARPDARFVYVGDDAAFPYGALEPEPLIQRVVAVIGAAIDRFQPDIAVIACNTASTLVLPSLRSTFAIPFVGTVPAVKPAAERSHSGMISVLATPGTVRRDYTHDLIIRYAPDQRITLVGATNLAREAEKLLHGEQVDEGLVAAEIAPCFREREGKRTDVVVLACTHYPLLIDRFRRLQRWPVQWLDPAPAIARRLIQLIGEPQAGATGRDHLFCFSSGKVLPEVLRGALAARGFAVDPGLVLPFAP
jgi:glutamate racemase